MCHNDEAAVAFVVRHDVSYNADGTVDDSEDNTGVNSICLVCMDPVQTFVLKCSAEGEWGRKPTIDNAHTQLTDTFWGNSSYWIYSIES